MDSPLNSTPALGGVGEFWLAGQPDVRLPGVLRFSDGRPELELIGGFGAVFATLGCDDSGHLLLGSQDDPEPLLIHGELVGPCRRVTLTGARDVRSEGFFKPSYQKLSARHMFVGTHLSSEVETFRSFRFRISGLEQWLGLPATALSLKLGLPYRNLKWEGPKDRVLSTKLGSLIVQFRGTSPSYPRNPLSSAIGERAWLVWTPNEHCSLEKFLSDAGRPLRILMGLIYRAACSIEELQVASANSDEWYEVYGVGVSGLQQATRRYQYLISDEFEEDLLAYWLSNFADVSPIPQLVTSSVDGHVTLLEVNALMLCTAIEGLHKRLHPEAKERFKSGRRKGELRDLYFRERLKVIVSETTKFIPEIAGRSDEWLSFVTEVRNLQAHQYVDGPKGDEYQQRVIAATEALRWVLTTRLVQDAGLIADDFHMRIRDDPRYTHLKGKIDRYEASASSRREQAKAA